MESQESNIERSLVAAYRAESRAEEWYRACAHQAETEGNLQVAKLFRAVAASEKVHTQLLLKILRDGMHQGVLVTPAEAPPIESPEGTPENLRKSLARETEEFTIAYPRMMQDAEIDAWDFACTPLKLLGAVERVHAVFMKEALDQLGRNQPADYYVCNSCGNIIERKSAGPCEICAASQDGFHMIH